VHSLCDKARLCAVFTDLALAAKMSILVGKFVNFSRSYGVLKRLFALPNNVEALQNTKAMKAFRPIVAAITLFAVLVNTAGAMPCCCSIRVEHKRSCCEKANRLPKPRACCATNHVSGSVGPRSNGCCCIDSRPASPLPREGLVIRKIAELPIIALCFGLPEFTANAACYAAHQSSDRTCLYGPPLLAMHCCWLN